VDKSVGGKPGAAMRLDKKGVQSESGQEKSLISFGVISVRSRIVQYIRLHLPPQRLCVSARSAGNR
jgi:hypothetical protein